MLIDWFTVGAQALNFVILVWLMKRFLYRPILDAIDAREARIAAELAEADARKSEAHDERVGFQRKNEEFDQERAALMTQATEDAEAERRRLDGEAREAAEIASAKRRETLRRQADDLSQAIGRRTRDEVFAIARMALADLAGASLEVQMSEAFTRRVRELSGPARARLGASLVAESHPALVRSAFELPSEQRRAIQAALDETFAAEVHVRFETAPQLIAGVELSANGQKVAWSIDDCLRALERSVDALVGEPDQRPGEDATAAAATLEGASDELRA